MSQIVASSEPTAVYITPGKCLAYVFSSNLPSATGATVLVVAFMISAMLLVRQGAPLDSPYLLLQVEYQVH
jgi:hypothetical protein